MSLTNTTRVKAILGIPAGVTFNDVALGYAVDAGNSSVLRCLGQTSLAVTTQTEYAKVYGGGQSEIMLQNAPIVGIVAITNGSTALATTDYRVDADKGIIALLAQTTYWSTDRSGVLVTYGWGYDADSVPPELKHAADVIAVAAFRRARVAGMRSESEGGYRYDVDESEIPASARAILSAYTRVHHG